MNAELLRSAQAGDNDACEQAVRENSGLIWSIARRYFCLLYTSPSPRDN